MELVGVSNDETGVCLLLDDKRKFFGLTTTMSDDERSRCTELAISCVCIGGGSRQQATCTCLSTRETRCQKNSDSSDDDCPDVNVHVARLKEAVETRRVCV